jgi:hypothetical protein
MAAPAQALVTRFGAKPVTLVGLASLTFGALWYTQIDVDGSYQVDLLPGFVSVGIGIPFTYIPITIAALAGVSDDEAGLASGLLNTLQQVGGAIGLAVISTVAFEHAEGQLAEGAPPPVAFTEGFEWGFWVTAAIWLASLVVAAALIRRVRMPAGEEAVAPSVG